MVPSTGNPAIDLIPTGTQVTINSVPLTLCPTTDEQGTASLGNYCDAGAVQTNTVTGSFDPNGGSGSMSLESELHGDAKTSRPTPSATVSSPSPAGTPPPTARAPHTPTGRLPVHGERHPLRLMDRGLAVARTASGAPGPTPAL
jgi:hypothetical protein